MSSSPPAPSSSLLVIAIDGPAASGKSSTAAAVARALGGTNPPAVLVEAGDGADDGRRKLLGMAKIATVTVIDCLTRAEMSLALGRENVVHAALKSGRLSSRLAVDAGRLGGFRGRQGA